MSDIQSFEDLIAWQKARSLTKLVYQATAIFPAEERFGLTNQMRRCAVSIPSNIAEGWGRGATLDYERFLKIARGSCYELRTQVMLAVDLGFLDQQNPVVDCADEVQRLLNGLIKSLQRSAR